MKSILTLFFAILAFSAFANFSGNYDPANWTETHSLDCDDGFVELSAPSSIALTSSDNYACGGSSFFGYSIPLTACGTISFNWEFNEQCYGDSRFGYSVNGVAHQLTNDFGGTDQYGFAVANVSVGDVFSFYIYSTNYNMCSAGYCAIGSFNGPSFACQNGNKVSVCHNGNTLCIAPAAVPAHLAHGDYLGECGAPGCVPQEGGNGLQSIVDALDPEANKEGKAIQIRSSMITLQESLAKETTKNESKMIDVYPNPANDQITIANSLDKNLGTISIMDITGKIIFQKKYTYSEARIDLQDFSPGIYYIRTDDAEIVKFVKQ